MRSRIRQQAPSRSPSGWPITLLEQPSARKVTGLARQGDTDDRRSVANYPQAYPLWNILIVALNIVVLYALTAHWRGFKTL